MRTLERGPRRIDDEGRKAEKRQRRLDPPTVSPHRLAKAATRDLNQVRCHLAASYLRSLNFLVSTNCPMWSWAYKCRVYRKLANVLRDIGYYVKELTYS